MKNTSFHSHIIVFLEICFSKQLGQYNSVIKHSWQSHLQNKYCCSNSIQSISTQWVQSGDWHWCHWFRCWKSPCRSSITFSFFLEVLSESLSDFLIYLSWTILPEMSSHPDFNIVVNLLKKTSIYSIISQYNYRFPIWTSFECINLFLVLYSPKLFPNCPQTVPKLFSYWFYHTCFARTARLLLF